MQHRQGKKKGLSRMRTPVGTAATSRGNTLELEYDLQENKTRAGPGGTYIMFYLCSKTMHPYVLQSRLVLIQLLTSSTAAAALLETRLIACFDVVSA